MAETNTRDQLAASHSRNGRLAVPPTSRQRSNSNAPSCHSDITTVENNEDGCDLEKRKLPRQQTLVVRFEPSILDLVKGLFQRNNLKQKFERSITAIESDDMDERMFDRTRSPFDLDVHVAPKANSTDFRKIRCWFDTCCFQGNIISKQFVSDLGFEEADYEPLTPREELGGQTMNGTIHPVEAAILLTWHHNTGPRYRNMRFLISSTLDSHTMIIGTRSIVKHDLLSPPVFMSREARPKQVFRPIQNDEDLGELTHALRVLERDIKNIDADIKRETDEGRLAQHQEARKGQEHKRDLQKYRIDIHEANKKGNLDEAKRLQGEMEEAETAERARLSRRLSSTSSKSTASRRRPSGPQPVNSRES